MGKEAVHSRALLGRPKNLQKREAILQASRRLFLDHGFEATTIEGVAALAGVSRMTVYGHFDDKLNLFANVVSYESRMLVTALNDVGGDHGNNSLESVDDVRNELLAFGIDLLAFLSQPERKAFNKLIDTESTRHPQLSEVFKSSGPRPVVQRLAQRIAVAAANHIIDVKDPLLAACHFVSLLKGIELAGAISKLRPASTEISIRSHVEACVQLFLSGCGVAAHGCQT